MPDLLAVLTVLLVFDVILVIVLTFVSHHILDIRNKLDDLYEIVLRLTEKP
jgi:hypothetical protein